MPYVFLSLAIVCEVFGSTMLKMSDGFTVVLPSVVLVVAYVISFAMLGKALETIPLGVAYGIWGGVGTAATALIGMVLWGEAFTAGTALGLLLIVGGIVLVNRAPRDKRGAPEAPSA